MTPVLSLAGAEAAERRCSRHRVRFSELEESCSFGCALNGAVDANQGNMAGSSGRREERE